MRRVKELERVAHWEPSRKGFQLQTKRVGQIGEPAIEAAQYYDFQDGLVAEKRFQVMQCAVVELAETWAKNWPEEEA